MTGTIKLIRILLLMVIQHGGDDVVANDLYGLGPKLALTWETTFSSGFFDFGIALATQVSSSSLALGGLNFVLCHLHCEATDVLAQKSQTVW